MNAVAYALDHAITTGGNCTAQGSCVYEDVQATLKASGVHAVCYALDQQGGKGGANYAEEVMPTLCSDSHGTPHAVAVPYPLKIRTGVAVDSAGKAAGKGALIQTDKAATLAVAQDQYLFQPIIDQNILDDQGGSVINVRTDGKSPTLRAQMGGHPPVVMVPSRVGVTPAVVSKTWDARGNGEGDTVSTITGDHENRITDYTSVVVEPVCCIDGDKIGKAERAGGSGLGIREGDKMYTLTAKDAGTHSVCIPIHDQATRFAGKRGDKSDGKGNGLGVGNPEDPMNTLTSGDRHAVAYGIETFHCTSEEEKTPTLKARDWKDPHLTANNAGGNQRMPDKENFNCVVECHPKPIIRYIVRRLTPTECARLQGFPDNWGHIDEKSDFTEEEYAFWLNVRNTHAAINGKVVKDYTKAQMLTWYNKLHTDSSEYKLWGNGIALPCALYVMQGIAEGLHEN